MTKKDRLTDLDFIPHAFIFGQVLHALIVRDALFLIREDRDTPSEGPDLIRLALRFTTDSINMDCEEEDVD